MRPARILNADFLFCLLLFAGAALFRFAFEFHQYDDAFITYRYAANLIAVKGFVYNEGARVLGTTTPLFTLVLAFFGLFFGADNLPVIANWVNHLADGGTAVLFYWIGLRLWRSRALALVLALFFVFSFHSVFNSGTGMETSFFSFLVLFAMQQMLGGRPRSSFALAALALMTRPDALILIVALVACRILIFRNSAIRNPKSAILDVLPAAGLLIPYFILLHAYFGSVMPQSVVAKALLWNVGEGMFSSRFGNFHEAVMFLSGFLFKTHSRLKSVNYEQAIPTVALFGLGCLEIARRDRRFLLLPAFGLLFIAAYAKSGGFLFQWYLVPTVPYLILATFAGFVYLAGLAARRMKIPEARLAAAVCAIILVLQSFVFVDGKKSIPSAIKRVMYPSHTEKLYRHALTFVHPAAARFSIMAPEIGYIGFFRPDATIIDPFGLTNPEVTDYYRRHPDKLPRGVECITPAIVEATRPDYIVSVWAFLAKDLRDDAFFKAHYESVPAPLDDTFTVREPVFVFKKR